MSKTILAEVDGFTPVIDGLLRKYGASTALVFGRVWRYCQMSNRVCQASMDTIAEDLGFNRSTVKLAIHKLVSEGYLKDLSPDLRNHPHTYQDTGLAGMNSTTSAWDGGGISTSGKSTSDPLVVEFPPATGGNSTTAGGNSASAGGNSTLKIGEERIKERDREDVIFSSSSSGVQGQVGQPDLMQPVGKVPRSEPPADPVPDLVPGLAAAKAWEALLYQLEAGRMVSKTVKDSILSGIKPVSLEDGQLVLRSTSEYARAWFISRFQAWTLRQLVGICKRDDVSISVLTPEVEAARP